MYQVPHTFSSEPLNPWLSMWTRPRATIRQIVVTNPTRHVHLLAMINGVALALSNAERRSLGEQMELSGVVFLCLLLGPVGGLFAVYITSALLRWSGGRLGGQASAEEVRAAYAWSSVPGIWLMPLSIPEIVIFGRRLFMDVGFATETERLIFLIYTLVDLLVGIWATVVFLKCLSEVQGFSAWKALGSVLVALLAVSIPLALLGAMLSVARG